jgi:hypothetical protein
MIESLQVRAVVRKTNKLRFAYSMARFRYFWPKNTWPTHPLVDTAVIMSFGRQTFGRKTFGRQTLGRHVVDEAVPMVDTTVDGLTSFLSTKCQSAKWFSTKRGGTDGHYRQKLESECKTLGVGGQCWIGSNFFFHFFFVLIGTRIGSRDVPFPGIRFGHF